MARRRRRVSGSSGGTRRPVGSSTTRRRRLTRPEGGPARAAAPSSTRRRRRPGDTRRPEVEEKKEKKQRGGFMGFAEQVGFKELLSPGTFFIGEALERLPGRAPRVARQVVGGLGFAPAQTLRHPRKAGKQGVETVTGIPETVTALNRMRREQGYKKTGAAFLGALVDDYKRRYGPDWEEHAKNEPLSNLFDTLSILGGVTRGAALSGAASRLGETTRTGRIAAGLSMPVRTWRESSRPGLYELENGRLVKNASGPPGRVVAYHPPRRRDGQEPKTIEGTRRVSRSPLMRAVQEINDDISGAVPEAPLIGLRSRATRAQASQNRRAIDRAFAKVAGTTDVQGLNRAELTRAFFGTQMNDHSAAALRAVKQALQSDDAIDLPGDDAEFGQWLRAARKQGFSPGLMKRLDAAIDLAEKVPEGSKRYARAIEALEQMTQISEDTIKDAGGFGDLGNEIRRTEHFLERATDPDEIEKAQDKLDGLLERQESEARSHAEILHNRRNLFRDWVWANTTIDSKERNAWHRDLTKRFGSEEADNMLKLSDQMARVFAARGVFESPEDWYAQRVSMPSDEGIREFQARIGDNEAAAQYQPGRRSTLEGAVETAPGEEVFYSPLQRWVNEFMPEQMDGAELEQLLLSKSRGEEFYNMGLDLFFHAHRDKTISREQFLNHLAHRLNAYNLTEIYRSGTDNEFFPKWGPESGYGELVSRKGERGDYREITMELPAEGRDPRYFGKGFGHWKRPNVVFHVRFQVFEENGIRKLLVEEIQSDWRSDAAEAKKAMGEDYEGGINAPANVGLLARRDDTAQAIEDMRKRADELMASDDPVDWDEAEVLEDEIRYLQDDLDEMVFEETPAAGVAAPPSPLGNVYYRAALRRLAREAIEENVDEIIITHPSVQHARNLFRHPEVGASSYPYDVLQWWDESVGDPDADISGAWQQLYGETFPNTLRKEYGEPAELEWNAYTGRYSTQGGDFTNIGPMPGIVVKVSERMREKASQAQAMYQRPPNWKALPKGATEFLGGRRTALRMFETADVSTWVHELAHIALPDLSAEERSIIERQFGAGLSYEKWTPAYHENYARAFERYLRDGIAPNETLQPVFARIAKWIGAVWAISKENVPEISEDTRRVFDSMLTAHGDTPGVFMPHRAGAPNLQGARTSQGIPRADRTIGDRTRPRAPIFAKNRLQLVRGHMINDDPRVLIEHMNRVVMLARANQLRETVVELADPLLPGETPDFDHEYIIKPFGTKTDDVFYDAIENSDDPEEIAQRISDFLDENIGERDRWNDWAQPDANGRATQQLYTVDKATVDQLFKNMTGRTPGATTKPQGTASKLVDATLDTVRAGLLYANPGFYISNLGGNALMTMLSDPRAARYLIDSFRQAGKAAAREGAADPEWRRISVEVGRGPTSGGLSTRSPVLGYQSELKQIARAPRAALKAGRPGKAGRAGEAVSAGFAGYGRRTGRIIDDAFRVAAWKQAARRHGIDTREKRLALLDQGIEDSKGNLSRSDSPALRTLNSIRAETEQLMLDFDSMTPFEKTWLTRLIFLYPFVKASAKWPAFFAGERPITTGALGQLSLAGQQFAEEELGPRPDLPRWMEEYARGGGGWLNVGGFAPQSMALNLLSSGVEFSGGTPPTLGVSHPLDYLNPAYRLLAEMAMGRNRFGRGMPWWKILYEDAPLTALQKQLLFGKEPSEVWRDQDLYHTLLRSLRIVPTQINEQKAKERAKAEKKAREGA